jgi:hypothetical protein
MPSVSDDGRFVLFTSASTNLVPGDTNGTGDVFLRDRQNGTTVRVSVDSNGNEAQGRSAGGWMTSNGRFVVFGSDAPNLAPGGTTTVYEDYVRDLLSGTTEIVSIASDGSRADDSSDWATASPDGRWIAFISRATNLVAGDTNGTQDVFLRDRQAGTTERMSVASDGTQANYYAGALWPALSDDGRFVAFPSRATNLVPGDTNDLDDVFVRDHQAGAGSTAFTSFCDPGSAGVIDCPCSNPAAGPGRGCDNSAGTGGAQLMASGVSRISADTLVFSTTGELPASLSIVVQATTSLAGGRVYGQGVRCLGGWMARLYTKMAQGGGIMAPDFAAGDPPVSVRSAQRGDMIIGGQSRWYAVYYRDPTVLGGCPASSSFNATQAGEVSWTF